MTDTQSGELPHDLIELGRIVAAYGVQGWVKIQPHSSAEVLQQCKNWWLKAPAPLTGGAGAFAPARKVQVLAVRPHGATLVAQLDAAPDRNAAEALKGHTISVPRSQFPPEDEDEVYWVDLIGCLLYGQADNTPALIGQVVEVSDNGAHAVLHVARARLDEHGQVVLLQNQKGRNIEVLVPFVQAHVHTVDIAAKRLDSDWPVEF
ncbi:MAG TPA: ribosome maturation factor RimM [Pusillimonas sp.]|uniref:ribosome maturation factor RimM n=1 Tax=Pusillimonas sp. TaxID=3040095 RepID=UPI002B7C4475|nr:ribosome maturation factor RimM [Pusillimonas sp.]HUH87390.1 ribosome maturation factor RimM [Pusillimonas sp.]